MFKGILRHIVFYLSLASLALTTSLQYTHDTQHQHDSSGTCSDQENKADTCGLCWFMAHQISTDILSDFATPSPVAHHLFNSAEQHIKPALVLCFLLQKGNKDPPSALI